ncbi:MAG: type II 3-dehydroquinate dehydratase [Bacteroidales bacterium]|nr:type II 3-dehydroquinate dehydratase [Bacteroidales bacterium]
MKVLIINGPNLNLLGKREPGLYGNLGFDEVLSDLRQRYPGVHIDYFQSNIEGELIDCIQSADGKYEGVILNAGAYTHTSLALGDAVKAVEVPVIEVHISNILAREHFRHISYIAPYCKGLISGLGTEGYRLALEALKSS